MRLPLQTGCDPINVEIRLKYAATSGYLTYTLECPVKKRRLCQKYTIRTCSGITRTNAPYSKYDI